MAKRRREKRLFAETKAKNGGARRRKAARPRTRRNPSGVVIGDSALELRYEGGEGKRKKGMRGPWKHEFESDDVQVIGKRDGAIELRSKSGARLWDNFEV